MVNQTVTKIIKEWGDEIVLWSVAQNPDKLRELSQAYSFASYQRRHTPIPSIHRAQYFNLEKAVKAYYAGLLH